MIRMEDERMEISFTLNELDEVYLEALKYYQTYKKSIDLLKRIVDELQKYWQSEETGTYESFITLFNEKYKVLLDIGEQMKQYCDKLNEKKSSLQFASKSVINNFE